MRANVQQLETLFWIARLGSFRAAAARLGISQPSVSLRMKTWERELGLTLFKRKGRAVVLSDDGAAVLEYAERIMGLIDDLDHRLAPASQLQGLLRLGVPDSFALLCLGPMLGDLETRHPRLKVAVSVENSSILARRLEEGALDTAVLAEPPQMRSVRLVPLGRHKLLWVTSPNTSLPEAPLRPADLAEIRIFTNPAPSNTFTVVMDWFADHGVVPARINTCNSVAVILALVTSGLGISPLPRALVHEHLASGRLRMLPTEPDLPMAQIFVAHVRTASHPAIPIVTSAIRNAVRAVPFLD